MRALLCLAFSVAVMATALVVGKTSIKAPTSNVGNIVAAGYEGGTLQVQSRSGSESPAVWNQWFTRSGRHPYIVIDTYANRIFLRTADSVILDALCSTGSGGELVDTLTGRRWRFHTPTGAFMVHSRLTDPWWRKPDWAFVEEGLPIPNRESERLDNQMMGDYAIGFGDGYFIHGTIYERLLGKAVTHGCVRMAAADLKKLYDNTRIGTVIYVY